MKLFIWIGATVGGILGGWLGSVLDHGSMLGPWSIVLSSIGGVAGIWLGYKAYQNWG